MVLPVCVDQLVNYFAYMYFLIPSESAKGFSVCFPIYQSKDCFQPVHIFYDVFSSFILM